MSDQTENQKSELSPAEIQSIVATQPNLESSSTRHALRVRQDVYVPLVFTKGKFLCFKRKHLLFLDAFKPGVPLAKAAEAAGLSEHQAMKFLRRKDVRAWMHDLSKEAAIQRDWDRPAKWWKMGDDILNRRMPCDEATLEVWREFGARVAPKPSRNAQVITENKIEINIDPGAVDKAMARQRAIDAEISGRAA